MDKKEAIEILERYKNWNKGQSSVEKSFGGEKTEEDEIYDLRRRLIKKAYTVFLEEELKERE